MLIAQITDIHLGFDPINPEPPMTTIFMGMPLCPAAASDAVRSLLQTGQPTAV